MIIKANLSVGSLTAMQEKLTGVENQIDKVMDYAIDYLLEKGSEYCKQQIASIVNSGYSTGLLESSVTIEKKENQGIIKVTAPYARFREFGIGVRGKGTYPSGSPYQPYTYKVDSWTYYNDQLGRLVKTEGYRAGHFMHDTYMYVKSITKEALEYGIKEAIK